MRRLHVIFCFSTLLLLIAATAQAGVAVRFEGPRQIPAGQTATYNVIAEDQVEITGYELRLDSGRTVRGQVAGKMLIIRYIPLDTHRASTRQVRIRLSDRNGRWSRWFEYLPVVVGSSDDVPRMSVSGPVGVNIGQRYPLTYRLRAAQMPRSIEVKDPFTRRVSAMRPSGRSYDQTIHFDTTGVASGNYIVEMRAQGHTGRWSQWARKQFRVHDVGGGKDLDVAIQGHDAVVRGNRYTCQLSVRSSEPLRLMQIRAPFTGRVSTEEIRGTTFLRTLRFESQGVQPGQYNLEVRVKTSSNRWSVWERKVVRVNADPRNPLGPGMHLDGDSFEYVGMPYVLTVRCPAPGGATSIEIKNPFTRRVETVRGVSEQASLAFRLDTGRANPGNYAVEARARGRNGQWGAWARKTVRLRHRQDSDNIPTSNIYFLPPVRQGGTLELTYGVRCLRTVNLVQIINPFNGQTINQRVRATSFVQTTRIPTGNAGRRSYIVRVRARNDRGQWGNWATKTVYVR